MTAKKISKRGRPRQFDIDLALAKAKSLFHQRGFDGVGVSELSQAIGITPPSLYTAFGSKSQLFERVLEKYVVEEGGWMGTALSEDESVPAAIARLFERAAEVFTADVSQLGCLVLSGTDNSTDACACALTAKFRQGSWQFVRDRIAREYPEQATELANYVMTILLGLSAAARKGASHGELQASGRLAAAGVTHLGDR